jgi:hypothetical protein
MAISTSMKTRTLIQRELLEYQGSMLKLPAIVAVGFVLLMLLSVIFADRVAFIGDGITQLLMNEGEGNGIHVTISVEEDASQPDYRILEESAPTGDAEADEGEWNFSREWSFHVDRVRVEPGESGIRDEGVLNVLLHLLNGLFLFLLIVITVNYLLGALYQDRKDRSILFWKSMPVGEFHEVLSKMMVASLVAPVIFLVISVITQIAYVLLTMLLVWRLDAGASSLVLGKIDFVSLFSFQLAAMLHWILWTAPLYAWLLLASASSKRSPFLLAFGLPLLLIVLERVFLGSSFLGMAMARHLPALLIDDNSGPLVAFGSLGGPGSVDYVGMLLGLFLAFVMLWAAAWLRRTRFEI